MQFAAATRALAAIWTVGAVVALYLIVYGSTAGLPEGVRDALGGALAVTLSVAVPLVVEARIRRGARARLRAVALLAVNVVVIVVVVVVARDRLEAALSKRVASRERGGEVTGARSAASGVLSTAEPARSDEAGVPRSIRARFCTRQVGPNDRVINVAMKSHGRGHAEIAIPVGVVVPSSGLVEATLTAPASPGPLLAGDLVVVHANSCHGISADEVDVPFHWPDARLLARGLVVGEMPENGDLFLPRTRIAVREPGGRRVEAVVVHDANVEGPRDPALRFGQFDGQEVEAYGTCYPAFGRPGEDVCWAVHVIRRSTGIYGKVRSRVTARSFAFEIWPDNRKPEGKMETPRVVTDELTVVDIKAFDARANIPLGLDALEPGDGVAVHGDRVGDEIRARFVVR